MTLRSLRATRRSDTNVTVICNSKYYSWETLVSLWTCVVRSDGYMSGGIHPFAAVGKSNLLNRLVDDKFTHIYAGTIGIDFRTYITRVNGTRVKLQIWDTAGQERFRALNSQYYRGADAALLVFDVTNRKSFDRVENWVKDIESHNNKTVAMLVAGNKCDLSEQRVIADSEGRNLARTINTKFMTTSAIQKVNVQEAFDELARRTLELKRRIEPESHSEAKSSKVQLGNAEREPVRSRSKCT
eukprot:gb/GECG01003607.1/.p1 GENE.gb/GECG01003607.1/~~gb/GECG01003607.1/.p1  ORF type:complete len:242 (+),score=22.57 gb/GECG01003607.1/:1-726(+)